MKSKKHRKIHIIGAPCSGKSFLAKKLAKKLKITHYNLNDIFWKPNSYSIKEDESIRNKNLKKIIKKEKWITEGVFLGWIGPCLKNADLIIFLKVNTLLRLWRAIRRYILRSLGIEKTNKHEGLKQFYKFLKYVLRYPKRYNQLELELKPYKNKVRIIKNSNIKLDDLWV